jgi:hypothetical protein
MKNTLRLLMVITLLLFNSCDQSNAQLFDLILEIKSQNDQLLNEVKTLQLKSDLLIAELRISAAKQEELLTKVTDLQNQLSSILSQIVLLNKQLENQNTDVQVVKDKLAELQTQYQGIVVQLQELQKLSQILAEVEKMKTQITQLDTRYTIILAGLVQNKQQLDALKTQITSTQTQLADNLTKISQLIGQLGDQGVVISNILKQIELIKNNNAELIKLLESLLSGKSPLPTDGLVGWWPFNGNANDESGYGNNGTLKNVQLANDRFGNYSSAYYFNGSANILLKPIPTSQQISISYWVKSDLAKSGQVIVQNNQADSRYRAFSSSFGRENNRQNDLIDFASGRPDNQCNPADINVDNINSIFSGSEFVNKWTNITGIITSNGTIKLYINGILKSETRNSQGYVFCNGPNSTLRFGGPWWNGDPIYFRGFIDDIAIWNRELTIEEITKIYRGEKF